MSVTTLLSSVSDTLAVYFKAIRLSFSRNEITAVPAHKHLLLLTWAFPPDVTGGVYRPLSIVRAAKENGWRVTVICGYSSDQQTAAGKYLEDSIIDCGTIVRIDRSRLSPSYKLLFLRINGGFVNLLDTIDLASKILGKDQPSVILASGPPFHNFVAARELSKRFSKPYVLDYRDEWTECPFEFVETGNIDRYFEKRCLRDSSKIIFTTNSHLIHQKQVFGLMEDEKLMVIPNGWEAGVDDIEGIVNPLCPSAMRISFLGHLGEHTLPRDFLQSLELCLEHSVALRNILRIAFVGSKSDSAVAQLNAFKYQELLDISEVVPKPVALRVMRESAALLLINEPRLNRYRPGKIYDYVAMRVPILVYGGGGEIEEIVTNLRVGVVVFSKGADELTRALHKLAELKENCVGAEVDNWLAEHTRASLAKKMMNVLESIEDQSKGASACL